MPQLMWCVYLCVCVLQWATYMASACWMLRAWWRRLSAGNKFPRSVSVWRRPPSSWEGIRPAALRERSPLWVGASPWFLRFYRTLSISVSAPASGSSHTDSHTHFNGCHFLYCSSACVSLPCFFSEASSLISAAHCVSFILPRLLTELFIPAPCWRLCTRALAAPAGPCSALFMWSMSSYVLPSLTGIAATFPLRSRPLQAPCRSCWQTGN